MRLRTLYSLLLTLLSVSLFAQFPMDSKLKQAHELIFSLKFDSAQTILSAYEKEHPDQQTTAYLKFNILFLRHFVDEDEAAFIQDKRKMIAWLDEVKDGDKTSPYYHWYVGEMKFELAALEIKFGRSFSGAQYALGALSSLEDGGEEHPDFPPLKMGTGLLNVAIGSVPENYKFLASMLGYSGDLGLGLDLLREATQISEQPKWKYLKTKSVFVYLYVIQQLDPNERQSVKSYGLDPHTNPLLAFLESKMLQKEGDMDELIDMLLDTRAIPGTHEFPYMEYTLGRAKLTRGDEDANLYFLTYLQTNKGVNYIKSTLRYLSWYYRLRGQSARANLYRSRVLEEGKSGVGADLEALRECETEPVALELLKARLAFDLGEYQSVLTLLKGKESSICKNQNDHMEFHYRLGRSYEALKDYRNAITSLNKAIQYTVSPVTVNRVYSELHLALLYERANNKEKARHHFENVLEFDDYPWYEGTQQKAKAGLERLEE